MLASNYQTILTEAGCDEAGRGCLAGPVVAAAVILPFGFTHPLLDDSKKLTERVREELFPVIQSAAIAYGVGFVSPQEIDEINILQASFLAMHRALDALHVRPELLLIDGNRFKSYQDLPHHCIIKGDGKFAAIAAASVLAKVSRDRYMLDLHTQHPDYKWISNKGYPSLAHRAAIAQHGTTAQHRLTFRLLKT